MNETDELERALDHLLDCFSQACWERKDGKYDHMCLSSYESAQDFLIEMGKIKPEECSRK